VGAAQYARMVHLGGHRERALPLFEELMRLLPPDNGPNVKAAGIVVHDAAEAREWYGNVLAAEGRPQLGIPLLESAERHYHEAPEYAYEVPRVRLTLGDAYARAGRTEDARRTLKAALDDRVRQGPADSQAVLAARERWGRFLLTQGDLEGAETQFREVVAQAHERKLAHVALALGGLASLDLARGEAAAAVHDARAGADLFDHVEGFRDVRMGPYLWRICARAERLAGNSGAAQAWARRALEASLRYDAPESAAIEEARALLSAGPVTPVPAPALPVRAPAPPLSGGS